MYGVLHQATAVTRRRFLSQVSCGDEERAVVERKKKIHYPADLFGYCLGKIPAWGRYLVSLNGSPGGLDLRSHHTLAKYSIADKIVLSFM